jgi:shikimate dehydrogenase
VTIAEGEVVLLGAGAAARSLGLALLEAGAAPATVWARRPEEARAAWAALAGVRVVAWDSAQGRAALARAAVVVNATPRTGGEEPCPLEFIPRGARVVDLVYGAALTRWVVAARAAGLEAVDGLGLLVHQARLSLGLWTGREVPLAPLARAVGWPR